MELPKRFVQTLFIAGMSLSAVIGAIVGSIIALTLTGFLQADQWLSLTQGTIELSPEALDSKIIELIEEESATIAVVKRVAPSVVSIVIKKEQQDVWISDEFGFFSPYGYEVTPNPSPGDTLIEVGGGTGFFITKDGYIVTNHHVVADPDAVYTVVLDDGRELSATVIATDPFQDIAILDVEGEGYAPVTLGNSDVIVPGQTVIAIGNSLSEFENTVTKGVISGLDRSVVAYDYDGSDSIIRHAIQTDAAINPGNSGGPLINLLGEVVGVNTAISSEGESIGFAIPINDVKKTVSDVQAYGHVVRPWLGVHYTMLNNEIAAELEITQTQGAMVIRSEEGIAVFANSPAGEVGLQEGDVILSLNGETVTEENPLGDVIYRFAPGDEITMRVWRSGSERDVVVILQEYPTDL
ncbi:MAG: PDZ/DHR/GLGF domain protein [Candidatus Uhrbacteria bacterium GW2011_GWE2_46_68]|uniref:PDZ/DHR/GLGF domain protein n=2 Tax=Candidatus Uhriibacteriota TaxID=1752732 RepID=A0A0G1Q6E2_9BACT|nr:MAG: PDZ/DHR/GLGF domain protein [Candidatus Uhrbacteria bacterium GW2011_GWF2_46_218]KKU40606.1 MAG: PDZ/DHR/GLGF domain protein [Candidatus Uhrbacteria bacterium GW2011_GWE2_46_68]